jgi:hypothetical protein
MFLLGAGVGVDVGRGPLLDAIRAKRSRPTVRGTVSDDSVTRVALSKLERVTGMVTMSTAARPSSLAA